MELVAGIVILLLALGAKRGGFTATQASLQIPTPTPDALPAGSPGLTISVPAVMDTTFGTSARGGC